jgi:dynein heavy chain, axonemal
MERFNFEG